MHMHASSPLTLGATKHTAAKFNACNKTSRCARNQLVVVIKTHASEELYDHA